MINKLLIVPIIIRCWYTNSLRKVPLCIDVKFKWINTIYNTITPCYECLFYSLFLFRIKMLTQINKNKQWNSQISNFFLSFFPFLSITWFYSSKIPHLLSSMHWREISPVFSLKGFTYLNCGFSSYEFLILLWRSNTNFTMGCSNVHPFCS